MTVVLIVLCAVNVFAFLLYGYDKLMAIWDKYRVPEAVLLISAVCMGALGAYIGMRTFKHKTKKWKFTIVVPALAALQILGIMLWVL